MNYNTCMYLKCIIYYNNDNLLEAIFYYTNNNTGNSQSKFMNQNIKVFPACTIDGKNETCQSNKALVNT